MSMSCRRKEPQPPVKVSFSSRWAYGKGRTEGGREGRREGERSQGNMNPFFLLSRFILFPFHLRRVLRALPPSLPPSVPSQLTRKYLKMRMRGRRGGRASMRSSMYRADLSPESEEKEMST